MKKLLLNIYYWPAFIAVTLVGLGVLPFILFVNVAFLHRKIDAALRLSIRFYGWILVCLIPFFKPVKVYFKEKILPAPAIYVANHNSAIDPYLFGAIAIENSFVTSWPFKIPVYRFFMQLAGYANTDEGWEEVKRKCSRLLETGCSVTIWPEGHRSRDGSIGRFKKGAFNLAVELGVPIIPVCILGSGTVLPPGQSLLNPGTVKLHVMLPIYPGQSGDDYVDSMQLKKEVRAAIEGNLREKGQLK